MSDEVIKCSSCGSEDVKLLPKDSGFAQYGIFWCCECRRERVVFIPFAYFLNGCPAIAQIDDT